MEQAEVVGVAVDSPNPFKVLRNIFRALRQTKRPNPTGEADVDHSQFTPILGTLESGGLPAGVGMAKEEPDLGRFKIAIFDDKDRGAFKTPTVRNVSLSAPYMHDGSQRTLEEVVEWYDKGGHPNKWLSDKMKPLKLTDQEQADVVAFMVEGLAGEFPIISQARGPQ